MAIFKDTGPMNDTGILDTFQDISKTIQDSLTESMAEFMRQTAPKDSETLEGNDNTKDTMPQAYLSVSMDEFMRRTSPKDTERELPKEDERFIDKDHLYESMAEFMERTSLKDTAPLAEGSSDSYRLTDIESDFARDFGFSEADFLQKKLDYETEILDTAEQLRDAEYRDLYIKFTDEEYTKGGVPNCDAFAHGWSVQPITGEPFKTKPQPGEIAGCALTNDQYYDLMAYGTDEEIKATLVDLTRMDCAICGEELIEVSHDYVPKDGERMIALMHGGGDYHYMLKGEYGYWYHKPGALAPTRFDDSLNPITDPATCDRGIYHSFDGYFVIRDKEV